MYCALFFYTYIFDGCNLFQTFDVDYSNLKNAYSQRHKSCCASTQAALRYKSIKKNRRLCRNSVREILWNSSDVIFDCKRLQTVKLDQPSYWTSRQHSTTAPPICALPQIGSFIRISQFQVRQDGGKVASRTFSRAVNRQSPDLLEWHLSDTVHVGPRQVLATSRSEVSGVCLTTNIILFASLYCCSI